MDWQNWITNEAISNYIIFLAGLIAASIGWLFVRWLTKKHPSIIRITKRFQSSLVSIDDDVKDKLKITYNGKGVAELYQAIFTVENTGEEPIKDIEINFYFDGFQETDFLEAVLTNAESIQTIEVEGPDTDLNNFTIQIPFLNPRKEYEDYLGITIYAPRTIFVKAVTGKGYGWSTKYVDRVEYVDQMLKVLADGASPVGFIVARIADLIVRR